MKSIELKLYPMRKKKKNRASPHILATPLSGMETVSKCLRREFGPRKLFNFIEAKYFFCLKTMTLLACRWSIFKDKKLSVHINFGF